VAVMFGLAVAGCGVGLFAGRQTSPTPETAALPLSASAAGRPLPTRQAEVSHVSAPKPLPPHAEKHSPDVESHQIWVLHGEEFVVVGRSSSGSSPCAPSVSHRLPGIAMRVVVARIADGDFTMDMADCGPPPSAMSSKAIAVRASKSATKSGTGVWKIVVVQGQREAVCEDGAVITVLPGMIRINVPSAPPKSTIVIRPKGMIG
jgi:hypothetical protein